MRAFDDRSNDLSSKESATTFDQENAERLVPLDIFLGLALFF